MVLAGRDEQRRSALAKAADAGDRLTVTGAGDREQTERVVELAENLRRLFAPVDLNAVVVRPRRQAL